jgi:prepilin-type N-terminal cleavage/methylation domain-containing protein
LPQRPGARCYAFQTERLARVALAIPIDSVRGLQMGRRGGFTLIELVVIILILGILAGVAAPKFFNATGEATDGSLQQTLRVVRDAIDMYWTSHGNTYPPCTGTGADFKAALAEYLRSDIPACPVGAKNADIAPASGATTAGDAAPSAGWKFNTTTGDFICNSQATSTGLGMPYDKL